MALKEACDVYDTINGVGKYRVGVYEVNDDGEEKTGVAVITAEVSLCPRALTRLRQKIAAGCAPPTPRKTKEKKTDDAVSTG